MSMYSYSLSTLRSEVLTRYDLPASSTSTKPTTAQLTSLVNTSIRRFTNLLLALYGDDYLTTMSTVSTVAGTATVSLPTRCFRVQGVAWVRGQQDIVRLRRATVDDLLDGGASPTDPRAWDTEPMYSLLGQTLTFVPVPSAVYTIRLVYAQLLANLSADVDTVELGPAWDDWVINDVCSMIAQIREDDPSVWVQFRDMARADIEDAAKHRDDNDPPRVRRLFDAGIRDIKQRNLEGEYY